MSELGKSVFTAFEFLNDFLKDASKLFTEIEESMGNNDLAAIGDAAIFWGHSRAYYAPNKWLPKYLARHYVAKPIGKEKANIKSPWFAFFVVYLTPPTAGEPFAVWGIGKKDEEGDLWEIFNEIGLHHIDGSGLFEMQSTENWKSPKKLSKRLKSLKYQARPVIELYSAQVLEEIVIGPLIKEVKELRES